MKKKFVFYMVAAALAMALAGCSSEDDDIDDWIKGIKEELRATREAENKAAEQYDDWMRHVSANEDILFPMIRGIKCMPQIKNGRADDIVGQWKVIGIYRNATKSSTDYSCGNTMWNFRADGVVSIESDMEVGIKGDFSYNFAAKLNYCPLCDPGTNMTIYPDKDGQTADGRAISMGCRVLKNTMVLGTPQWEESIKIDCMVLVRIQ